MCDDNIRIYLSISISIFTLSTIINPPLKKTVLPAQRPLAYAALSLVVRRQAACVLSGRRTVSAETT